MMACFIVSIGLGDPKTLVAGVTGKDIFSVDEAGGFGLIRARPTNGSDRGFARSNLTRYTLRGQN